MKDILGFLKELKSNNNRDWMHANKPTYQKVKKKFQDFIAELIEEIATFDEQVTDVTTKEVVFRINRDIRFSKDKTPYKQNFGAAIAQGGKKSKYPIYYIHIQPDNSFVGGGIYQPSSEILAKIRQEIDYNLQDFKEVVEETNFKDKFGKLSDIRVKTSPKGYSKDNPAIDYLRLKSFITSQKYDDKAVLSDDFKSKVIQTFKNLKPLQDFLYKAID